MGKKPEKILILTSSGGGGHLQAAKAKRLQLALVKQDAIILQRDVLVDWLGKTIGGTFAGMWNRAQQRGDVKRQEQLLSMQPAADKLFFIPYFTQMWLLLKEHDITHVIDTQPVGTSAILTAIQFSNRDITYEKIITELPTDRVSHFFDPIKKLTERQKRLVNIFSTDPLLGSEYTNAAEFWKEQCGLPESRVHYDRLPLRPSFLNLQALPDPTKPLPLSVQTHSQAEAIHILETMGRSPISYRFRDEKIHLTIEPTDRVSLVMLGSKPHQAATLEYVSQFINLKKKFSSQRDILFVFCSQAENGLSPLLEKVNHLVTSTEHFPEALTIIPMSFQEDDLIAPLFFRADAALTRSGGLTAMELLSVCQGQIWIHSEPDQTFQNRPCPMPHWEEGNANYLQEKKGAKFIDPTTFEQELLPLFS